MLAAAATGAALLMGAASATAQAAPATSGTSTTSVAPIADSWIHVGTYRTLQACYGDGVNSAYSEWDCKGPFSSKWQLWVNDGS
ncbi:hypothetical protein [Streptomyces sp. ML-6]|uniref:hypothetical protein n=1 Tax=Streptomyces sp. ML-6 TaxID=2982693 RepID=UPI0024BF3423|nr:hypothetical protein [Streptomyces sp. ML-6]MDK0517773.1 hypothetical protein [Streptomyces sp. ML-6]